MRSYLEITERLNDYRGPKLLYYPDVGFIAWQLSTGENVELLFIEVKNPGHGQATFLVKEMCKEIKPFNSVFVFRLASNETAGHFYRHLGFEEQVVKGLYREDAVLGVVSYKKLCQNLLIA